MTGNLPDSLWVEREQLAFDIEIEYENPPYFCFTCNCIGHSSDHCRKDPTLKIDKELHTTKNDPPKKIKQVFVPKKHKDIDQGCSENLAVEDPLTPDIIMSKEVVANALVKDVLNIEEEFSSSISFREDLFPLEHVEEVHDLTDSPLVQNPPPLCGMRSANGIPSDEVLNPNVAHDLAILKQYWEGKDARDIGHRVYTDIYIGCCSWFTFCSNLLKKNIIIFVSVF
jgi:hypothetical protein